MNCNCFKFVIFKVLRITDVILGSIKIIWFYKWFNCWDWSVFDEFDLISDKWLGIVLSKNEKYKLIITYEKYIVSFKANSNDKLKCVYLLH